MSCKLNSNINYSTMSQLLGQYSMGKNYDFWEMCLSQRVMFFTNWNDSTHFPAVYGSGIHLPALDSRKSIIIYSLGDHLYTCKVNNDARTFTWYEYTHK